MADQKKKKYNEREFLSVIPEAMPAPDDQQSIPLRETVFLTLRKLILTGKLDPGERLEKFSEPAGLRFVRLSGSWKSKDWLPSLPAAEPE